MGSEQIADDAAGAFGPGSIPPALVVVFGRLVQILFKNTDRHLGEVGIENVHIGFIIDAEGTIIEVGQTDGGPLVVDDHGFGVKPGGSVFVNSYAFAQQVSPTGFARQTAPSPSEYPLREREYRLRRPAVSR